jgi:enamine deaminase RidA (YjgF/YER057c/UK114 family)
MSNAEKAESNARPLTMSAERLQQIRERWIPNGPQVLIDLMAELDARELAHAETREQLNGALENADDIAVKLGVECDDMTDAQVWHASVQAIKALREQLAQAQKDTEHVMRCRELQCGICGRIEKDAALRAKQEPPPAKCELCDCEVCECGW